MFYTETEVFDVNTTTQSIISEEDRGSKGWYEQLVANYDYERPKRGQVLEGVILRIDEDAILVDVGLKRDGIVPARDLSMVKDQVVSNLSIGDKILVYVLQPPVGDQDLIVSLNKGIEHENWEEAEERLRDGSVVNLEVVGKNRGGLLVKFKSLQGFVPYSQVPELRRLRDRRRADEIKDEMVGTILPVKVIEVNRERRRLIFSAQAAQKSRREQCLERLEKGQIVYGKVVNITDFGVFIGLDGLDGLVHISELDWKRVDQPADLVKIGEEMEVQVIDVDKERERVSLSRKSLLPNPWKEIAEKYQSGDSLDGKVTKILDFGAFIELPEGIEGLVHVSELGYSAAQNPKEAVKVGETVLVRILSIEPEKERISLSMRQVPLEKQIAWTMDRANVENQAVETQAELETEAVSG